MMTDEELEKLARKCCEDLDKDYCIGNAPYDTVLRYLKEVDKINQKEIDSANSDIDNLQVNTDRGY
jgi:hypothetical protein